MKTSFALFLTAASAASTDAQVVGKSSKAESFSSLSYSFADVEGKSGKAGIRYLIDVDQFEPRELHGAHMSYRMFVPRAKTFKSGKSLARTAAFESGDMSFSMPSAKSIKIFIEEDLPTISSKSAKAAHLSGTSSKSAKTGHFSDSSSKASANEQPFSAKGSKSDREFISKASKSSEHTNLFERFLDVDVWELEGSMPDSNSIVSGKSAKFEMSYSILDLVVPEKSVKLVAKEKSSKAKKEPNPAVTGEEKSTVSYEKSSKAGKANIKVSPRSIDPSAPSNDSIFYATAIDFTRMVDPPAEESTAEETSGGVTTIYGLITMGVSFVAVICLY